MNTALINKTKYCILIAFIFPFVSQSCVQKQPEKTAVEWTQKMKEKILENANQQPDKKVVDTNHYEISLFKNGKVLKHYYLVARTDAHDSTLSILDTAMVVYYGDNQNFQLIQEPCRQGEERSYEVVAYKGNRYGFAQYIYCLQKSSETGFQFNNVNVGTWTTYDSAGAIARKMDVGNSEKLLQLDSLGLLK